MIKHVASTDARWTEVYTVRDGDTLGRIAKGAHVSLADLLKHNSQFDAAKTAAGHAHKTSLEQKNKCAGHRNPNDISKGDRVVVPSRGDQARAPSRKPLAGPPRQGPVASPAQKPTGTDEKAARLSELRQQEQALRDQLHSNAEVTKYAPDISTVLGAQISAEQLESELAENKKQQAELMTALGGVKVEKVGVDFQREDSWSDAKYSDATAQILTQGGAIIGARADNKKLLEVPLSDANSIREQDFTKIAEKGEKKREHRGAKAKAASNDEKGPVYVDRTALNNFLVDPKHQKLVERLAADHVTLPTALGHAPIPQPPLIEPTRRGQ